MPKNASFWSIPCVHILRLGCDFLVHCVPQQALQPDLQTTVTGEHDVIPILGFNSPGTQFSRMQSAAFVREHFPSTSFATGLG